MKRTLIRPLVTEKTLTLAASGWYTFVVAKLTDKKTIGRAISDYYKVKVTQVRVAAMHGKTRKVGKRSLLSKKPDWKKAIVRLASGQKIDAFEVAPTEEGKSV